MNEFDENDLLNLLDRMPKNDPKKAKIWWKGCWVPVLELKEDAEFCQRYILK